MKLLAQSLDFGTFKGVGTGLLGNTSNLGNGIGVFTMVISTTIGIMTIVAIIWFLIQLITGAIGIMTAGGDKQALENARKKITYGLIGFIIVIAAVFILGLVGVIFGINFLDLKTLFDQITGGGAPASTGIVPPRR